MATPIKPWVWWHMLVRSQAWQCPLMAALSSQEEMRRLGGDGVEPFNAMVEGGVNGQFYQEMIDYFYYAQIKAQGENTTAARKVTGEVPMEQVPDLLRALGVYPSDWDIRDILQEIR